MISPQSEGANAMSGYEYIKELQRQMRASGTSCTVKKMLALAPNNDPYYSGSPAQIAQAEWFAEIWQRFGYAQGVHLRRIHYQLAIQPDSKRHDGMAYSFRVKRLTWTSRRLSQSLPCLTRRPGSTQASASTLNSLRTTEPAKSRKQCRFISHETQEDLQWA